MSFDFSTLITDRTAADVAEGTPKGAYNAADLNRVTAALDDLWQRLLSAGYTLPRYKRIVIDHVVPKPEPESRLPEGYTELAWIESTGTQYVDTGFKPKYNTRVVVDVSELSSGFVFGARSGSSSGQFTAYRLSGTNFRSDYFGTQVSGTVADTTGRGIVDKNANVLTMYGVSVTNTAVSSGESNCSLLLFALNTNGSPGYYVSCKMHSSQIYDNGTLVRDFVPCTNPSGAYGLYDLVNAQFYGNAGSGSFTGGDAVAAPATVTATTAAVVENPTEYDPYLWYEIDVPQETQMRQYLTNVNEVRTAFAMLATTPDTPESMELLTWAKANHIEQILVDADTLLTALAAVYLRSGMVWAHSGAAGFYFMN